MKWSKEPDDLTIGDFGQGLAEQLDGGYVFALFPARSCGVWTIFAWEFP